MDLYSFLRNFADSWFLLAMTLFFLGVIAWVFRPSARITYEDISQIPLRNDTLYPDADQGEDTTASFELEAQK